jgi:integrase
MIIHQKTCSLQLPPHSVITVMYVPLTKTMIIHQKTCSLQLPPHSVITVMYQWQVISIYAGPRPSEWAQPAHVRTFSQVLTNPFDGLPRAFILDDVEYFTANRRRIIRPAALEAPLTVQQIDIRWRWQKNGTRNQKKTFVRIPGDPLLCAVSAWLRISQRYLDLRVPPSYPLAIFTDTGLLTGTVDFIRPVHIETALRQAAQQVYNITDPADLAKFTSHSFRVGACCALHAAGVSTMDIQYALRWRSTAFTVYLRNLPSQAARVADAVLNFDPTTFTLVPNF